MGASSASAPSPMAKKTAKRRTQSAKPRKLRGHQALADHFQVSTRTVRDWVAQGLPHNSHHFDVAAAEAWVSAFHRKTQPPKDPGLAAADLAFKEQRARREQIRAEKEQAELDELVGLLLPRPAWEHFAATLLAHLGDLADQLPDMVSSTSCRKCKREIAGRVKAELERWRNWVAEELQKAPGT